ncbi:MAG: CPBP family intramembrane metalloprotease [Solirubrobacteraceae bacterium]|nr:CPBP family intramembrane metalloprotease [Solirubrobacteraceae bacterium]
MTSVPPPAYVHPGPPPDRPERPEGLPPLVEGADAWKPWSAWVAVVAALTVPIVFGIVAGLGVAIAGGDLTDMPAGVLIALTFLQDVGFIAVPLLIASWIASRPTARDFGLRVPERKWRAVGLIAAVYLGFIVLSAIWVGVLGIDEKDSLPDELGVKDSSLNLILVLLLVTMVAPVAEEMLFRGYMFRALRNWKGVWPAALLSGMTFGGIHLGSSPVGFVVPLMVFGVGLALLYQWTGSLYAPVALHALNNSIAFGATQDWEWQIPVTIAGSVTASLLALWLLARFLGPRVPAKPSPRPDDVSAAFGA